MHLSRSAFEVVGFSHWTATLAVFGSILGSLVDIPLMETPISTYPEWYLTAASQFSIEFPTFFPAAFPITFHPLYLAVNLGGCIIPLAVSAHLLLRGRASFGRSALGMAVVAAVTYYAAEAIPGEGIVLPFWLSPFLAAVLGLVLARGYRRSPPLAYISGTIGTLIGADLLSLLTPGVLPALSPLYLLPPQPVVMSIGGAGVFDGIFLTGIIAVLLAAGIVCIFRGSCEGRAGRTEVGRKKR
ncbi:MAG: DUF1614 domain-containing protein [Methanothrix sp.]